VFDTFKNSLVRLKTLGERARERRRERVEQKKIQIQFYIFRFSDNGSMEGLYTCSQSPDRHNKTKTKHYCLTFLQDMADQEKLTKCRRGKRRKAGKATTDTIHNIRLPLKEVRDKSITMNEAPVKYGVPKL
jgi:hypothetical protein